MQVEFNATAVTRRDHNPLDHRTDRFHRLITHLRIIQQALEFANASPIGFSQVRVDQDR
ncbi:hypothetical protein [Bosea sp. 124]|uniref:hypothetical protein n=1 Tax=Bosea sp. 124 TaxID=2135642 RepID=UPI0015E7BF69|nr:hypothetical protein [Bosea sp. 124]